MFLYSLLICLGITVNAKNSTEKANKNKYII